MDELLERSKQRRGEARAEMVFIGYDLDKDELVNQLDACVCAGEGPSSERKWEGDAGQINEKGSID